MSAQKFVLAALVLVIGGWQSAQAQVPVLLDSPGGYNDGFQPVLGIHGQMNSRGFEVTSVHDGSAAHRLGLERGDVITHVNGTCVHSQAQLTRLLYEATVHHQGIVRLRIDNIRWWTGDSCHHYVTRVLRYSSPRHCCVIDQ